jgi:hypothetical protein
MMIVGGRRRRGRQREITDGLGIRQGGYTSCPSVTGGLRRLPCFAGHPGGVHAMNEEHSEGRKKDCQAEMPRSRNAAECVLTRSLWPVWMPFARSATSETTGGGEEDVAEEDEAFAHRTGHAQKRVIW